MHCHQHPRCREGQVVEAGVLSVGLFLASRPAIRGPTVSSGPSNSLYQTRRRSKYSFKGIVRDVGSPTRRNILSILLQGEVPTPWTGQIRPWPSTQGLLRLILPVRNRGLKAGRDEGSRRASDLDERSLPKQPGALASSQRPPV